MTGELFEINGDELKVVSLDGHRISIRKIQLKDTYEPQKVVIPGKTLNEVSKILSGETEKMYPCSLPTTRLCLNLIRQPLYPD